MRTFVLIHGGGDSSWSWHLVQAELRRLGHEAIAVDLPADDDSLTLDDYADAVVQAIGDREHVTVVGHSLGGFTATLVADRIQPDALILVAGMIPSPGETPGDWWQNSGYNHAVARQAEIDGGLTGNEDPFISFMHDVPRELAEEAMSHGRNHPSDVAMNIPWPLSSWPDVPTRFILCRDDRFFPAQFFRRLVPERLGITPEEIAGSHCVMLSNPVELARMLVEQTSSSN